MKSGSAISLTAFSTKTIFLLTLNHNSIWKISIQFVTISVHRAHSICGTEWEKKVECSSDEPKQLSLLKAAFRFPILENSHRSFSGARVIEFENSLINLPRDEH